MSLVTTWKEATLTWRDSQEQETESGWSGCTCIHAKCGIIKILIQLAVHIWGQEWNASSPCNFRAHTHEDLHTHMHVHRKKSMCVLARCENCSEYTQSQGTSTDVHGGQGCEHGGSVRSWLCAWAEREGVPGLLAHAPTSSWAFFLPDLVFFLRQSRLHVYREGA